MTKIQELTQKDINNNVATTKDFWEYSKIGLKAPFSFWKNSAPESVFEIINWFNGGSSGGYFNIIFNSLPLLKGEFPCVYIDETGVIITNYRYIVNGQDGLQVIPFHAIKSIGEETQKAEDVFDKGINKLFGEDKEMVVNYELNGSHMRLVDPEGVEDLKNIYNANEYSNLDETQKLILEKTYYEFEKFNPDLNLSKISWVSSLEYASQIQPEKKASQEIVEENESEKENNKNVSQEEMPNNITFFEKIKSSAVLFLVWCLTLLMPIVRLPSDPGISFAGLSLNFWQIKFELGDGAWGWAFSHDNSAFMNLFVYGIIGVIFCVFIRKTKASFFTNFAVILYLLFMFFLWIIYIGSSYNLVFGFYIHVVVMNYMLCDILIKKNFLFNVFNKLR